MQVWGSILEQIQEKIAEYDQSLETNLKTLATAGTSGGTKISHGESAAYIYIVSEKTQIDAMLSMAIDMINLLDKPFPDFVKELESDAKYD